MTIDDIYLAAINGEKEKLTQLLEAGEVDINQMLDGGVNNGLHSSFTMLFSVVNHMREAGFNFEILDILVRYGIDLDTLVVISSDAFTRRIPILAYAIKDWNVPQLAGYFLSRGANPNNAQIEIFTGGRQEMYPLAYIAIVFRQDHHVLNLLLRHGANPNSKVFTYNYQEAASQVLPLLFFAIVGQNSLEKAATLFSFGADPKFECEIGYGRVRTIDFAGYIRRTYPQFYRLLQDAQRLGRNNPMTAVPVSAEKFRLKRAVTAQAPEQNQQTEQVKESDPLQPLKDRAEQLILFDRRNMFDYRRLLEHGQFQSGAEGHEARLNIQRLNTERLELRNQLNELDRQYTGGKQSRWWNTFNGLTYRPSFTGEILVWMPMNRLVEGPDGLTTVTLCHSTERMTEAELKLLEKAGVISPVYRGKPDPNGQYHMAELCMWSIYDASQVHRETVKVFSDREIKAAVQRRDAGFNEAEQFLNMLQNRGSFTNEELHLAGQMGTSAFFDSQWRREQHIRNYKESLESATTVKTTIENRTLYWQCFRPVGIVLFDDKIENVSHIMNYCEGHTIERYLMDTNKAIYDIEKLDPFEDEPQRRIQILRNLGEFPIPPADLLGSKPVYLSEQEWYEFLYNCVQTFGIDALNYRISQAYQKALSHKKNTIESIR